MHLRRTWIGLLALLWIAGCPENHGDDADDDDAGTDDDDTGTDDDDDTGTGDDDDAGTDDDDANPCDDLLVETVSTASVIPDPGGAVPAAGAPFVIAETGVTYTRVSDVGDPDAIGSFYTNGYSRWSPASVDGALVTAFSSDGRASIYRLSDRTIIATLDVGEPNELHWDRSGVAGTETHVYYRTGMQLRRVDVATGDDVLVHDFSAEFPDAGQVFNGVEGAPSNDMRYWALQVCDSMTGGGQCTGLHDVIVYDKTADAVVSRLSDAEGHLPTPNYVDMAPSGSRIVVGTCKESSGTPEPWNGPYAWSLDFSSHVRLGTNCTHSGWAWGSGGEELFVSFDSCGLNNDEITDTCDHLMAVDVNDPSGWENRTPILYAGDLGWGTGTHLGRIYDSSVPGWFLLSTYGDAGTWAAEQLLFVEIVDHADDPRLWRIGPTVNEYQDYWSEAFASLDHDAQHIYWGANWSGSSNLELYQATLCDRWWEAL